MRASDLARARLWAAAEALAISLLACFAIVFAWYNADALRSGSSLVALLPEALIVGLVAATVYRGRMRSLKSSHAAAMHQEHLAHVVENSGVGIWEADLVTHEVVVSDSWLAMSGMRREDAVFLSATAWRALIHPDDRQMLAAFDARSPDSSPVFQLDHRLLHADGHWIWVASRSRVIERGPDGKPRMMVGTHVDITRRKAAEAALGESESKFRSLFERSPVGIALNDFRTGRFLQVNDALLGPSGYQRDELLQMKYEDLVLRPEPGQQQVPQAQQEREFRRKDGRSYPVMLSALRMTDANGRDVVWTIVQDISHRKEVEHELAAAARRDRLTGLANRTLFMERLQLAVDRVQAGEQALFAVLFLDFDRFKIVNDAMGHAAGDELLVQIAERLRKSLRLADSGRTADARNLIARFGGDEFLVLINDLDRADDAVRIADRLLAALSPSYAIQGREVHSSASIGIVTSEHCAEGAETVIRNADVAMYEAKHAGRACSVVFNDEMHTRLSRNLMIETSLRQAIGTSQISLVYQPIVELDSGKRSSVEALIRWNHPTLGPIPPAEFIPVAEESGLIAVIGEWVMQEACAALARWQKYDPARAPRVVSVNLSRAELTQGPRLLENVRAALAAANLPPQCLQIEVTEREVMRNPEASLGLMRELRQIGVRLAMDDFGTGNSSLGCLRDYPFDVIKIDQSFVRGISAGADTLAVIHATITLVENLGKSSVAEGVETAEQLAILQSLGCHYAQGYHLGRPLAEVDVMETDRTLAVPRLRIVG
jgi:diguanylate cyclase (GGDEF)-like protein/PAS domain S-box-containing protein